MSRRVSTAFGWRMACAVALAAMATACATVFSPPGDPARGKAVVEKWCSLCHNVGTNSDKATAPAFADVVKRPGRDATYLRNFVDDDHFPMTMHRLFEQERDDVLAYLLSLKNEQAAAR